MRIQGHARLRIVHRRPYDYDERRGIYLLRRVDDDEDVAVPEFLLSEEEARNLILNVGRVQMHKQVYGTSGLGTNGFNYIALSNDATAPAATDTTLASEIASNGLSRAQGTVTLPIGSGNQTTVDKTFTATGAQAAQKAAVFDAASSGNMNHEVAFTQRSLQTNDTIQCTYTMTLA